MSDEKTFNVNVCSIGTNNMNDKKQKCREDIVKN